MFCGQGCLSGSRPGKPICQLHGDPESWPRASLIVTRCESSCDAGCLGARRIAERGGRSRRWEHEQNLGMCGKRHHCPAGMAAMAPRPVSRLGPSAWGPWVMPSHPRLSMSTPRWGPGRVYFSVWHGDQRVLTCWGSWSPASSTETEHSFPEAAASLPERTYGARHRISTRFCKIGNLTC